MVEVWSQDGITVNAIGPGLFPTELTSAVLPDKDCTAQKMTKCWIGCWFFWFYDSRYVTGLGLMADGGGGAILQVWSLHQVIMFRVTLHFSHVHLCL